MQTITIKKTVEQTKTIEVEFPIYKKFYTSFYKIETPENFLKVENSSFIKSLQTGTELPSTVALFFDQPYNNCTEEEFNDARDEVLTYISDAFITPPSYGLYDKNEVDAANKIFDNNAALSDALNQMD